MGITGRTSRIERQIDYFRERSTDLLRREQAAATALEQRRSAASQPAGRLRRRLRARAAGRAEQRLRRRGEEREAYVEQELRAIMLTLEEQARRTRRHLDRELERLVPVQAEWERLGEAFTALQAAVATPAVESLAGQWNGRLEIPEFPVHEREGYLKPFPHGALLF